MGHKTFIGGVHPYDGKELSKDSPIKEVLPKGDMVYPVSQHIGAPAKPVVAVGDTVLKGQMIAEAGGELINVYYEYLAQKDDEKLSLLLTHNYEDVLGMTKLLSILSYKECIHGIADITGVSVNPYTAYDGSLMNELIISFENKFSVPKSVSFHDNDIYLTIGTTKSYVRAEIFEGEMRHFYSDYKNYYYLPKEDMAIHKSVAAYVDHEYREKCKAYNCYVRKTGTFIRQYSDFMKPEFRFDIKDKYSYFLLTEDFINSKQMVLSYVKHITAHLFNL
jgi:uncharacterized protein